MALPTINPLRPLSITVESLDPASFSPFGVAVTSPLPSTSSSFPHGTPPQPLHPRHQPTPVVANQSTALKYCPISPLQHNLPSLSRPQMAMFSCFPRQDLANGVFNVQILERHPYTTQTFFPLGLSLADHDTKFLVIVAPSRQTTEAGVTNPPDLSKLKAFIAHGGQGVTYGAGTWHAPMVVLGKARVDFVVTQFVSGVPKEDCNEVLIGPGVGVRVGELGFGKETGLWKKGKARAKL